MTKDELEERVRTAVKDVEFAGANVILDAQLASEEIDAIIRAALAIAMPAAFEIFGEAVKDGTCQCEACIDILVRELGEKWK